MAENPSADTSPGDNGDAGSSRKTGQDSSIRLHCPHCNHPIAIAEITADDDVVCPACGSSFQVDPDRTLAEPHHRLPSLGKYQLLERIGRGSFGVVYKACNTELDKIVAVKVPRSGTFTTRDDEDRFIREARSAAQLSHPGIVIVHDAGRTEDTPYIVSEYVEGLTLASTLTGRAFSFRESAELVAQVAEALEHSHQQGVVHRDLKPSNIMLERTASPASVEGEASETATQHATKTIRSKDAGASHRSGSRVSGWHLSTLEFRPRLMDFGLARREQGETTITLEGQVLGTPAYMSPEQARGEGHRVDGRSDIYSLGVILYELLAGERPFRGNTQMLLHQVLHEEPRPPRQLNHRIPRDLETICLKCLQKEPHRRYATAAELVGDLLRWLNGEPITARPVSALQRGWLWTRRNPVVASLIALVMFVLVAGSMISTFFAIQSHRHAVATEQKAAEILQQFIRAEQQTKRAEEQSERAEKQTKRAESETLRSEQLLYPALIARAQAEWNAGNVAGARQALNACRRDFRGWEYDYLHALINSNQQTILGHRGCAKSVAYSPDGRRIVSGSGVAGQWAELKLWDVQTKEQIRSLEGHTDVVWGVTYSPDGRHIASASQDKTVRVWDAETGKALLTFDGHTKPVTCVAFSPDGKRIASGGGEYKRLDQPAELLVWDSESGRELLRLEGHVGQVRCVVFSPDGQTIRSGDDGGTLKLWDAGDGREIRTIPGAEGAVFSLAISPSGEAFAAGVSRNVKVFERKTGQLRLTLEGNTHDVTSVAYSPDGKWIVSASKDGLYAAALGCRKRNADVDTPRAHSQSLGCRVPTGWASNRECQRGPYAESVGSWTQSRHTDTRRASEPCPWCRIQPGRTLDRKRE